MAKVPPPIETCLVLEAQFPVSAEEPDDYVLVSRVRLMAREEEEGEFLTEIGHVVAWRFNVNAFTDHFRGAYNPIQVFDALNQESLNLHSALTDEDGGWREDLVADPVDGDLLHIQSAQFPKDLAQHPSLLVTVERTIQMLGGGCGVVSLWPWANPIPDDQGTTAHELNRFWARQADDVALWSRLGFKPVPHSTILYRSMAWTVTPLDGLLEEWERG